MVDFPRYCRFAFRLPADSTHELDDLWLLGDQLHTDASAWFIIGSILASKLQRDFLFRAVHGVYDLT